MQRPARRLAHLATMNHPRAASAEEAVTNILYNTPPPSNEPFKRHLLNCLVQNEPGVLSRVSGILAGRGFNIGEYRVGCTSGVSEIPKRELGRRFGGCVLWLVRAAGGCRPLRPQCGRGPRFSPLPWSGANPLRVWLFLASEPTSCSMPAALLPQPFPGALTPP